MTNEELVQLGVGAIKCHDICYEYSDDPRYYHAGCRSLDSICEIYGNVDEAGKLAMVNAWNERINHGFRPEDRERWLRTSF